MKKTLLFAAIAASALLVGCQKDQTGNGEQGNGKAIGFRTLTEKTRATVVDIANINSFKVSAIWADDPAGAPTAFNHMDGINVTRTMDGADGTNQWTYAPIKYWPDADAVDFYAYSPAGSVNVSGFSYDGTNVAIEYTVPVTGAESPEDFLVAKSEDKTATSNAGQVVLSFEHALSLATFSAKNVSSGANYTITGIELVNLSNTGMLEPAAFTWGTLGTANQTYKAGLPEIGATVLPNTNLFLKLLGPNEGLMILPQTVTKGGGVDTAPADGIPDDLATAGKSYVKVIYGATDQVGGVIKPAGTELYFPLAITLAPKTAYEFQLTLGDASQLVPITFTVNAVTAWPAATPQAIPQP